MPTSRRKEPDDNHADEDSSDATARTSAPKRQRVALACDFCRSAKAKCDGDRPACGTCTSQKRACSYSHTSRKRGVRSGYLRSIELSISWLFEQYPGSEAALHRALVQNEGAEGVRILASNSSTSSRLRRQWNKSRVYKDIGKLLAQDTTQLASTSDDEFEIQTVAASSVDAMADDPEPPPQEDCPHPMQPTLPSPISQCSLNPRPESKLTLPLNWQHLVDVYFSYTSPWLPIVDRDSINSTALLYAPTGFIISADPPNSLHSQLWSVLAVASIQDAAASSLQENPRMPPADICHIAWNLFDATRRSCEAPYISSILVQSLILLGQSKPKEAWCLIGKATRLAIDGSNTAETGPSPHKTQMNRLLAASFILDTLTSALLGHPEAVGYGYLTLPPETFTSTTEVDAAWFRPLRHLHALPRTANPSSRVSPPPIPLFQQLFVFCQQWITKMRSGLHHGPLEPNITPGGLLQSLDPRYSFCNSLVPESGITLVPSTCLLQCIFLTITLDLSSRPRSTLILSLLELLELGVEQLGAFGLPPLIVTLMGIAEKRGFEKRLPDEDKDRWKSLASSLYHIWKTTPTEAATSTVNTNIHFHEANSGMADAGTAYPQPVIEMPSITSHASTVFLEPGIQRGSTQGRQFLPSTTLRFTTNYTPSLVSPQQSSKTTLNDIPQHDHALHSLPQSITQDVLQSQNIEDSAILEELGSIDYADTASADSQFMTNLGYDPGYDLAELFVSEYNMGSS
ncbi:hypothetical protein V2G26_017963 [Clonostachys chloroleuca]